MQHTALPQKPLDRFNPEEERLLQRRTGALRSRLMLVPIGGDHNIFSQCYWACYEVHRTSERTWSVRGFLDLASDGDSTVRITNVDSECSPRQITDIVDSMEVDLPRVATNPVPPMK